MNKLISAATLTVAGVVVLGAATPALVCLIQAVVPLVIAGGIVAAVLRAVWFYTRQ